MEFVDRTRELVRLETLIDAPGGGLAALWGRRRVGKTRLLLEWCRRHGGLYTVADLSAAPVQRRYTAQVFATRFDGFGDVEYPDWRAMLRALAREADRTGFRGPVVFDEFPYLVESDPALPSVMQAWIDHEARDAQLNVVVCGSAQHMMQGLVLDASAPLFGRASVAFSVAPMDAAAAGRALGFERAVDSIRAFTAWGGIPRYWELAQRFGKKLDLAVNELVLDPAGPLHQEPDRLLAQERPPAGSLRSLLDVIGAGANRVTEIAGRLGQPATSLSRPLRRLIEIGLVVRDKPYGESERGGKRSLYRIGDPFFRLWFRVVAPHRAWLAAANPESRTELWKRHRPALEGQVWEDVCRVAVPRLAREGGPLAGVGPLGPASRFWRGDGPEWDVVASSVDGKTVVVGEVKWLSRSTAAAISSTARQLKAKGSPPGCVPEDADVVRVVFVPTRPKDFGEPDDAIVIDAADVLNAFS